MSECYEDVFPFQMPTTDDSDMFDICYTALALLLGIRGARAFSCLISGHAYAGSRDNCSFTVWFILPTNEIRDDVHTFTQVSQRWSTGLQCSWILL